MSHFAKVKDGVVLKVIVAEQEFFNGFVDNSPGKWVQTSYNTRGGVHYAPNSWEPDNGVPLRKNFAGFGYTYDKVRDAFYEPKPYPSWTLNEDTCQWNPPTPHPEGEPKKWNEDTQSWGAIA
tara:strand:+ start:1089 stop:1454 length:366 start_codon:yes stop_codon:yes gene_type:complete